MSDAAVEDLLTYIHQSPTPYHCVAETQARLRKAGFTDLAEADPWSLQAGQGYMVARRGALVAFRLGAKPACESGFRIVGAHTDSPNLRVKPQPDVESKGYQQVGVEVYGGVLTYTWLDRDLGLAGVVYIKGDQSPRLLRIDKPLLRVPSLAIHLNRDISTEGLKLDAQKHLPPIYLADQKPAHGIRSVLAEELDVEPKNIISFDLSLMDVTPPAVGGAKDEQIFSSRLDNQASCHAGLLALLEAGAADATQVLCLYDHEEVGSSSATGAGGALVESTLRRITETEGPGATVGTLPRAAARSWQISADMAHAVHPNYSDMHEPQHMPMLNKGPVIKINQQQRYATSSQSEARFEELCQQADVPYQKFVNRTDLACGSTIGPISSTRLGIDTIDVGNPMLSMHSIREQAGAHDVSRMIRVMTEFFKP